MPDTGPPVPREDIPEELVEKAARVLFKRLKVDMGIRDPWSKMTRDDKQAFRDDVRAVHKTLSQESSDAS